MWLKKKVIIGNAGWVLGDKFSLLALSRRHSPSLPLKVREIPVPLATNKPHPPRGHSLPILCSCWGWLGGGTCDPSLTSFQSGSPAQKPGFAMLRSASAVSTDLALKPPASFHNSTLTCHMLRRRLRPMSWGIKRHPHSGPQPQTTIIGP